MNEIFNLMVEFERKGLEGETKHEYDKRTLEDKLEKSKKYQIPYLIGGLIAGGVAGWFIGGYAFDKISEITGWFAEDTFWHRANASMLGIGFMASIGAYATQAVINEYRENLRSHHYCDSDPQAKL